jgi:hypothetical protein
MSAPLIDCILEGHSRLQPLEIERYITRLPTDVYFRFQLKGISCGLSELMDEVH